MTTELVPRNGNALLVQAPSTLDDTMTLGKILAASGYFTDARQEAQAVVKVLYGREFGIPPVSAMMGIHIINGKPALSANLMGAVIKRSGRYNYRIARIDDEAVEIAFYEHGEEVGRSMFTTADAETAGLKGGNWAKFFRNMAFARALSNGARWYCPDLFGGTPVYVPEEMGAAVDGETGEVMSLPEAPKPTPLPEPAPAVEPAPAPAAPRPVNRASLNRALHAVMHDCEINTSDRAARHWWCSQRLGRPVESVADLTDEEVRTVTIWLQNLQPNDLAKMHAQYAAVKAAPPTEEEADPFADPPSGELLEVPAAHPSGPGH